MQVLSRRTFVVAASTLLLAACQTNPPGSLENELGKGVGGPGAGTPGASGPGAGPVAPAPLSTSPALANPSPDDYAAMYAPLPDDRFPVPGVAEGSINPAFLRRKVSYNGPEAPGTIVVDPARRYLYLVEPGGTAVRYGVGVGREGFGWSGEAAINSKQEWPDWYPPKEMIDRQPELKRVVTKLQGGQGVSGGPRNPLGARALYLYQNGKDTLFRIHGTTEPRTIGTRVSSGCIRLINQDIIDLYARTPLGAKVVVLNAPGHAGMTQPAASGKPRKPKNQKPRNIPAAQSARGNAAG